MQARILIVDDEPGIRFILEKTLSQEGYLLETASSGSEALQKAARTPFDLLLLDLNMKPVGGIQVLNAIYAQDPDVAVIILTAHSTIESAVEALRLGAFDYLFKPATPDVIRQRVRDGIEHRKRILHQRQLLGQIEGLRQTLVDLEGETASLRGAGGPARFVSTNRLVIDRHHRAATLDGNLLDLTTTEFDILVCLAEAAPRPVSPRELVGYAMSYDSAESQAREVVKWHIHQLRRKVESDPLKPRLIRTVRYKGYLWSG